jgi:hypothetical protein
MNKH